MSTHGRIPEWLPFGDRDDPEVSEDATAHVLERFLPVAGGVLPPAGAQPVQLVRRTPDGALDEIVVSDCDVHLERMSDHDVWIGISRGRGAATRTLHVHITGLDATTVEASISDDELGCVEASRGTLGA